ncbi:hypothetical protein K8I85_04345 [bacterium]|nr:hypothetical protein [bacterium]
MKGILGLGLLASMALAFGLRADADPDGDAAKVFLVYSADERSELAPCG